MIPADAHRRERFDLNDGDFESTGGLTYRHDIQGLRAVGALLVALFHIREAGVSGGVDVFFVVAGFLLASSAMRKIDQDPTYRGSFFDVWARFISRTGVEAAFVLLAACLMLPFVVSPVSWPVELGDLAASAIYTENVRLMDRQGDYLARGQGATLVLHFWAVSLIAQVYFLWPLLVRLSGWIGRRLRLERGQSLHWLVLGLSLVSFGWSVVGTLQDPDEAYFMLSTRFWEFGVGAMVATARMGQRAGARPRQADAFSWLSLLLVLSCGLLVGQRFNFPSAVALWPVLGAALLILFGHEGRRTNASAWLAAPRVSRLGSYSFGFYLWHWPIYIAVYNSAGHMPSWGQTAAIMAFAAVAAVLSYRGRLWLAARLHGRALPVTVLACLVGFGLATHAADRLLNQPQNHPILADSALVTGPYQGITPGPFGAKSDLPVAYDQPCRTKQKEAVLRPCTYGAEDGAITIAIVGGSHSLQWLPALRAVAQDHGWRIVVLAKSACMFADPSDLALFRDENPTCAQWNRDAMGYLADLRPDLVLTVATRRILAPQDDHKTAPVIGEQVPQGYVDYFTNLTAQGLRVLAIRDNPWMQFDVPACLFAARIAVQASCAKPRAQVLFDEQIAAAIAAFPAGVTYVDFTEHFCDETTCPATRDGRLLYRDHNHIAASYARILAPQMVNAITQALAPIPR